MKSIVNNKEVKDTETPKLTCKPKRYQHEPTTCPANTNMRRLITKLAQADSNMKPLAD